MTPLAHPRTIAASDIRQSQKRIGGVSTSLFWNHGVPLSRAWRRFAESAKLQRLKVLEASGSPAQTLQAFADALTGAGDEALNAVSARAGESISLQTKMRSDLLRWLHSGHVRAYGYPVPRVPQDPPQLVPSDLWSSANTCVRWEKDEVEGNGLKMAGVRLVITRWEKELLAKAATGTPAPDIRSPGRPGVDWPVQEAFAALAESGCIDCERPMTNYHQAVRDWLVARYPDAAHEFEGLNGRTITNHTRALFSDLCRGKKL